MKTIIFGFLLLTASAFADEQLKPLDPLEKNKVRVEAGFVKVVGQGSNSAPKKVVEVRVSPIGSPAGPIRVDFLFVKESGDLVERGEQFTRPQVSIELPAGSGKCSFEESHSGASRVVGWATRIVKDGRIIGIAGSAPKFEKLAADPATKMRYGNYIKNIASQ